jgi:hypothetical protein
MFLKIYDVDYFIFYDDNSTDNTNNVIYDILPKEKIIIFFINKSSYNSSKYIETLHKGHKNFPFEQ